MVYGGLGSTEHYVMLCVLIILLLMNALYACLWRFSNGWIFSIQVVSSSYLCILLLCNIQVTLTPPSPHPLLLHVMEM